MNRALVLLRHQLMMRACFTYALLGGFVAAYIFTHPDGSYFWTAVAIVAAIFTAWNIGILLWGRFRRDNALKLAALHVQRDEQS